MEYCPGTLGLLWPAVKMEEGVRESQAEGCIDTRESRKQIPRPPSELEEESLILAH